MKTKMRISIVAGLLVAGFAQADVLVDNFSSGTINDLLVKGGSWQATSDYYNGGSSKVEPPAPDSSDLVKGTNYSGDNTIFAYPGDNTLSSRLLVYKDVSTTSAWASAGWVLDFLAPYASPGDTTAVYNLDQWNRNNEVNLTSCTALAVTLKFDTGKQLWVSLFEPAISKNALAPQYGWRIVGTGAAVTYTLPLTGLGKPVAKWIDPANTLPFDLTKINRLEIFYEGQLGTSVLPEAPYDSGQMIWHPLVISNVTMTGTSCAVVPNPGSSNTAAIEPGKNSAAGFSVGAANGQLLFNRGMLTGTLNVTVRNIQGKVMAQGSVDAGHPTLNVSQLRNGIYSVQATNGKDSRFATLTLLN